jgi:hypothetical protein
MSSSKNEEVQNVRKGVNGVDELKPIQKPAQTPAQKPEPAAPTKQNHK